MAISNFTKSYKGDFSDVSGVGVLIVFNMNIIWGNFYQVVIFFGSPFVYYCSAVWPYYSVTCTFSLGTLWGFHWCCGI